MSIPKRAGRAPKWVAGVSIAGRSVHVAVRPPFDRAPADPTEGVSHASFPAVVRVDVSGDVRAVDDAAEAQHSAMDAANDSLPAGTDDGAGRGGITIDCIRSLQLDSSAHVVASEIPSFVPGRGCWIDAAEGVAPRLVIPTRRVIDDDDHGQHHDACDRYGAEHVEVLVEEMLNALYRRAGDVALDMARGRSSEGAAAAAEEVTMDDIACVVAIPTGFSDEVRQMEKSAANGGFYRNLVVPGSRSVDRMIGGPWSTLSALGLDDDGELAQRWNYEEFGVILIDPVSSHNELQVFSIVVESGIFETTHQLSIPELSLEGVKRRAIAEAYAQLRQGGEEVGAGQGSEAPSAVVEADTVPDDDVPSPSIHMRVDTGGLQPRVSVCLGATKERSDSRAVYVDDVFRMLNSFLMLVTSEFADRSVPLSDVVCIVDSSSSNASSLAVQHSNAVSEAIRVRLGEFGKKLQRLTHHATRHVSAKPWMAAVGAARMAGRLNYPLGFNTADILITPVVVLSIGVAAPTGAMLVVVPRNTSTPTRRTLDAVVDVADEGAVLVYEGCRASVSDNRVLGRCILSGAIEDPSSCAGSARACQRPPPPGPLRCSVVVQIDAHDVMSVSVVSACGSWEGDLTIRPGEHPPLSPDEVAEIIATAQQFAELDAAAAAEVRNKLECLADAGAVPTRGGAATASATTASDDLRRWLNANPLASVDELRNMLHTVEGNTNRPSMPSSGVHVDIAAGFGSDDNEGDRTERTNRVPTIEEVD